MGVEHQHAAVDGAGAGLDDFALWCALGDTHAGKGRGGMPAYQGQLRDREILDIVAHLRTLR